MREMRGLTSRAVVFCQGNLCQLEALERARQVGRTHMALVEADSDTATLFDRHRDGCRR